MSGLVNIKINIMQPYSACHVRLVKIDKTH